jgi:hypothetical protein
MYFSDDCLIALMKTYPSSVHSINEIFFIKTKKIMLLMAQLKSTYISSPPPLLTLSNMNQEASFHLINSTGTQHFVNEVMLLSVYATCSLLWVVFSLLLHADMADVFIKINIMNGLCLFILKRKNSSSEKLLLTLFSFTPHPFTFISG